MSTATSTRAIVRANSVRFSVIGFILLVLCLSANASLVAPGGAVGTAHLPSLSSTSSSGLSPRTTPTATTRTLADLTTPSAATHAALSTPPKTLSVLPSTPSLGSVPLPSHPSTISTGYPTFNVTAGSGAVGVAFDPINNMFYVTDFLGSTVSVISATTASRVATIPVGTEPIGVAFVPSENEIYVTNSGSGNVSVIDPTTNTVISSIGTGAASDPYSLVYDWQNGLVYVDDYGTDNLTMINPATGHTVGRTIGVGDGPWGLTLDNATGYLFVSDFSGTNVTVVSTAWNSVKQNITLGSSSKPAQGAYDPTTGEVFIPLEAMGLMAVLGGAPAVLENVITLTTTPYGAVYDPATNFVYVASASQNVVSIINASTQKIVTSAAGYYTIYSVPCYDAKDGGVYFPEYYQGTLAGLTTVQYGITSVMASTAFAGAYGEIDQPALDPTTGVLYVPDPLDDAVTEVNSVTQTVIGTYGAGSTPLYALYNPLNHDVYVVNIGGTNVTVFTQSGVPSTVSITVGTTPWGLALNPSTGLLYVANEGSGTLSVITTSLNELAYTIPLPACSNPYSDLFDPTNGMLYVTCYGSPVLQVVSVVNNTADGYVRVSALTSGGYGMALDQEGSELFVTSRAIPVLQVIDTVTNASLAVLSTYPGTYAYNAAFDPTTGDALIFTYAGLMVVSASTLAISWSPDISAAGGNVDVGGVWDQSLGLWIVLNTQTSPVSLDFIDPGPTITDVYTYAYPLGGDVGAWSGIYVYGSTTLPTESFATTFLGVPGCDLYGDIYGYDDCYPASLGTFTLSVDEQDTDGMVANWQGTFTVNEDPVVTHVAVLPGTSVDVGQSVSFHALVSGGLPTGWYHWTSTSAALSCPTTQETSWLNCTARAPGTSVSVSVYWEDAAYTDSLVVASANLTVTNAPYDVSAPVASSANPSGIDLGQTVSFSATVAGGASPLSYAWMGLPTGCLTADALTVTCTPTTAGTYWVSLNVTDGAHVSVKGPALTFVVSAAPTVTVSVTPASGNGEVGSELTLSASVLGGSGAGWFSWTAPAALGCVTTEGPLATCWPTTPTTGVTVSATFTDTNGGTATGTSAAVNVAAALSLGPVTAKTHTLDVGQTVALVTTVSGGVAPYTYTWTGLPDCAATTTGNNSCTAGAAGVYAATVWVTDSLGVKAEAASPAALIVSPALTAPTVTVSTATLTVGSSVSFTAVANGGAAPYTYTWTGLPTGCTGSGAVAVCTPTSSGTVTVSVSVTDANGATATSTSSATATVNSVAAAGPSALDLGSIGLAVVALVIALLAILLGMRKGRGPQPSVAPPMSPAPEAPAPTPVPTSPPPPPTPGPAQPPLPPPR